MTTEIHVAVHGSSRVYEVSIEELPGFRYSEYWAAPKPPSGCEHCGVARQSHAQMWVAGVGWHTWTMPSQQKIKQRMFARRETRVSRGPTRVLP